MRTSSQNHLRFPKNPIFVDLLGICGAAGRSGARQTFDAVRHVSLCRLAKTSCSDRDVAFGHAEEGVGQRSGHLLVRAASADISASNAFA